MNKLSDVILLEAVLIEKSSSTKRKANEVKKKFSKYIPSYGQGSVLASCVLLLSIISDIKSVKRSAQSDIDEEERKVRAARRRKRERESSYSSSSYGSSSSSYSGGSSFGGFGGGRSGGGGSSGSW